MIALYFSGREGLEASILAQALPASREADSLPCYTPFLSQTEVGFGGEGERWRRKENMGCFHLSLWLPAYAQGKCEGDGPHDSNRNQGKTPVFPRSAEQVGTQRNWACPGL